MGKHTPGPWKVGFSDGSGCADINNGATITAGDNPEVKNIDNIIIVVRGGQNDWGQTIGVIKPEDACLIAASPDLLEALKNVLSFYPYTHIDPDTPEGCAYQLAKAAIAKAEGCEDG